MAWKDPTLPGTELRQTNRGDPLPYAVLAYTFTRYNEGNEAVLHLFPLTLP